MLGLRDPGFGSAESCDCAIELLAALVEECRMILDEGVVSNAKDIDTCMIMGAGWPFFMGGITKYLDQKGYSKKVTGKTLAKDE